MFVEHKEALEVTESPAKIGKMSGDMRLGSAVRPQARQYYFADGLSCAIAAAFEGANGRPPDFPRDGSPERWAINHYGIDQCIVGEIIWKNDQLGWTRERIADWLEAQGL